MRFGLGAPRLLLLAAITVLGLSATAAGPAAGRPGTRTQPYKLGTVARLGGLAVSVRSADRHAWPALEAFSASNRPPIAGATYVLVTIRALNPGRAEEIPFVDGVLDAVARSGRHYSPFGNGCGEVANDVSSIAPIPPHSTAIVHVCWEVAASDAGSLVMDYLPYGDAPSTYFALR